MRRRRKNKRVRTSQAPDKPLEYRLPDCQKLLVCWNEYWTAGAMWQRRDGVWVCTVAEERIAWMRRCCAEEAKLELARLGCDWKWVPS